MHVFLAVAGASFLASFAAKLLADAFLTERIAVIGSFAGLQPSLNSGIAFGLRLPGDMQEIVIAIALAFVCVLAWKSAKTSFSRIGYGLIVGGALGNVIDRLRDGFVTDFFQIGGFPIFNVADSCITVGVVFLLAESIALSRRARS